MADSLLGSGKLRLANILADIECSLHCASKKVSYRDVEATSNGPKHSFTGQSRQPGKSVLFLTPLLHAHGMLLFRFKTHGCAVFYAWNHFYGVPSLPASIGRHCSVGALFACSLQCEHLCFLQFAVCLLSLKEVPSPLHHFSLPFSLSLTSFT